MGLLLWIYSVLSVLEAQEEKMGEDAQSRLNSLQPSPEHYREWEGDSQDFPTPGSHAASPLRVLYSKCTLTAIKP